MAACTVGTRLDYAAHCYMVPKSLLTLWLLRAVPPAQLYRLKIHCQLADQVMFSYGLCSASWWTGFKTISAFVHSAIQPAECIVLLFINRFLLFLFYYIYGFAINRFCKKLLNTNILDFLHGQVCLVMKFCSYVKLKTKLGKYGTIQFNILQ